MNPGSPYGGLRRHEEYYISTGDLHLVVDHTRFRVHRYFYERESEFFRRILLAPASPGATRQGASDDNAIQLDYVTSDEFAKFNWVFYNPKYSLYDKSAKDWQIILRLAYRWGFPDVHELAVRELDKLYVPDIDRVVMYQDYDVDRRKLVPCYAALAERADPITLDEGERLGLSTVIMLAQARELARAGPQRQLAPAGLRREEMEEIVKDVFDIEAPPVDMLYPQAYEGSIAGSPTRRKFSKGSRRRASNPMSRSTSGTYSTATYSTPPTPTAQRYSFQERPRSPSPPPPRSPTPTPPVSRTSSRANTRQSTPTSVRRIFSPTIEPGSPLPPPPQRRKSNAKKVKSKSPPPIRTSYSALNGKYASTSTRAEPPKVVERAPLKKTSDSDVSDIPEGKGKQREDVDAWTWDDDEKKSTRTPLSYNILRNLERNASLGPNSSRSGTPGFTRRSSSRMSMGGRRSSSRVTNYYDVDSDMSVNGGAESFHDAEDWQSFGDGEEVFEEAVAHIPPVDEPVAPVFQPFAMPAPETPVTAVPLSSLPSATLLNFTPVERTPIEELKPVEEPKDEKPAKQPEEQRSVPETPIEPVKPPVDVLSTRPPQAPLTETPVPPTPPPPASAPSVVKAEPAPKNSRSKPQASAIQAKKSGAASKAEPASAPAPPASDLKTEPAAAPSKERSPSPSPKPTGKAAEKAALSVAPAEASTPSTKKSKRNRSRSKSKTTPSAPRDEAAPRASDAEPAPSAAKAEPTPSVPTVSEPQAEPATSVREEESTPARNQAEAVIPPAKAEPTPAPEVKLAPTETGVEAEKKEHVESEIKAESTTSIATVEPAPSVPDGPLPSDAPKDEPKPPATETKPTPAIADVLSKPNPSDSKVEPALSAAETLATPSATVGPAPVAGVELMPPLGNVDEPENAPEAATAPEAADGCELESAPTVAEDETTVPSQPMPSPEAEPEVAASQDLASTKTELAAPSKLMADDVRPTNSTKVETPAGPELAAPSQSNAELESTLASAESKAGPGGTKSGKKKKGGKKNEQESATSCGDQASEPVALPPKQDASESATAPTVSDEQAATTSVQEKEQSDKASPSATQGDTVASDTAAGKLSNKQRKALKRAAKVAAEKLADAEFSPPTPAPEESKPDAGELSTQVEANVLPAQETASPAVPSTTEEASATKPVDIVKKAVSVAESQLQQTPSLPEGEAEPAGDGRPQTEDTSASDLLEGSTPATHQPKADEPSAASDKTPMSSSASQAQPSPLSETQTKPSEGMEISAEPVALTKDEIVAGAIPSAEGEANVTALASDKEAHSSPPSKAQPVVSLSQDRPDGPAKPIKSEDPSSTSTTVPAAPKPSSDDGLQAAQASISVKPSDTQDKDKANAGLISADIPLSDARATAAADRTHVPHVQETSRTSNASDAADTHSARGDTGPNHKQPSIPPPFATPWASNTPQPVFPTPARPKDAPSPQPRSAPTAAAQSRRLDPLSTSQAPKPATESPKSAGFGWSSWGKLSKIKETIGKELGFNESSPGESEPTRRQATQAPPPQPHAKSNPFNARLQAVASTAGKPEVGRPVTSHSPPSPKVTSSPTTPATPVRAAAPPSPLSSRRTSSGHPIPPTWPVPPGKAAEPMRNGHVPTSAAKGTESNKEPLSSEGAATSNAEGLKPAEGIDKPTVADETNVGKSNTQPELPASKTLPTTAVDPAAQSTGQASNPAAGPTDLTASQTTADKSSSAADGLAAPDKSSESKPGEAGEADSQTPANADDTVVVSDVIQPATVPPPSTSQPADAVSDENSPLLSAEGKAEVKEDKGDAAPTKDVNASDVDKDRAVDQGKPEDASSTTEAQAKLSAPASATVDAARPASDVTALAASADSPDAGDARATVKEGVAEAAQPNGAVKDNEPTPATQGAADEAKGDSDTTKVEDVAKGEATEPAAAAEGGDPSAALGTADPRQAAAADSSEPAPNPTNDAATVLPSKAETSEGPLVDVSAPSASEPTPASETQAEQPKPAENTEVPAKSEADADKAGETAAKEGEGDAPSKDMSTSDDAGVTKAKASTTEEKKDESTVDIAPAESGNSRTDAPAASATDMASEGTAKSKKKKNKNRPELAVTTDSQPEDGQSKSAASGGVDKPVVSTPASSVPISAVAGKDDSVQTPLDGDMASSRSGTPIPSDGKPLTKSAKKREQAKRAKERKASQK